VLFLADESCDFAVIRKLRDAGYDVVAVAELSPRSVDRDVLDIATREQRVLLTEDKDFGRLVFADAQATGGVILIRYPAIARAHLADEVLQLVTSRATDLYGRFVVMRPGRVRIGPKQK
jgi:predicted nuclease of predicted toxin-antitoxin system